MKVPRWLWLASLVALLWGAWGALIEIPEKRFSPGFPSTLGYVVWSLTMVPFAIVALHKIGWRLEFSRKALGYGASVGLLGAGGQLLLFRALASGPAYLVFPLVSLAPLVTVALSAILLGERAHRVAAAGVTLSLAAIVLLSITAPDSGGPVRGCRWLAGALAVLAMWGVQAYLWKASAGSLGEESVFFYMTAAGLALAPAAWRMTDFTAPVNWGPGGLWLTALIQMPNSLGALLVIYAMRSGKAIIVSPTVNGLYPVIAMLLSLALYGRLPSAVNAAGMLMAVVAIWMMSYGEYLREKAAGAPGA
jgi:drug/metabolite transporter (DMT)-like permease